MLTLLAVGLNWVVVEMAVAYFVAQRVKNAGVAVAVWAGGFTILTSIYFVGSGQTIRDTTSLAMVAMMFFWSVRLTVHKCRLLFVDFSAEDPRFNILRSKWGILAERNLFGYFQLQGLHQLCLSVPVLIVLQAKDSHWGLFESLGMAIWGVGVTGQWIADEQLASFQKKTANSTPVLDSGLWKFSRHPSHFFEWIVWVGYAFFASGTPWGWVAFFSPALLLHAQFSATGIPLIEQSLLELNGNEYRAYQQRTSVYVPRGKRTYRMYEP